jgi:hypothetical protein
MKATRILTTAAVALVASAGTAFAQGATQTVTFQVDAINQIAVTGTPSLRITTASAGSAPTTVTTSGTWAVTTNQTNAKITASIPTAMPTGLTLSADLGAPAGASSAGTKALGTSGVDLVTGITKLNATGLTLNYTLEATPTAGVVSSATRVVTFTITGGV